MSAWAGRAQIWGAQGREGSRCGPGPKLDVHGLGPRSVVKSHGWGPRSNRVAGWENGVGRSRRKEGGFTSEVDYR